MLLRVVHPPRLPAVRAYSVFSSKPGGGRYFNSAKPPKAVPPATNSSPANTAAASSPATAAPASEAPAPPAAPAYPRLSAADLRLHQFFALHRPLFLQQPPAALFARTDTLHLAPPPADDMQPLHPFDITSPEADADAARQLARALAMQRVGAAADWAATLRRLGVEDGIGEGDAGVLLDSTKRKRKRKMKKHKLKKRRRLNRMKEEEKKK
ncbi:hypothetical protein K488DRAFT_83942 [Vararia minispora EC-137]|uniref:Uncharacterized protein n=1 Tax=Vararia minispora EC-137 TaxID=1314806 RepID=A0ACB8QRS2_9AGAM|nr:hypothetical protein K488DRAFT_83942 [Vararia minispora EC-137]